MSEPTIHLNATVTQKLGSSKLNRNYSKSVPVETKIADVMNSGFGRTIKISNVDNFYHETSNQRYASLCQIHLTDVDEHKKLTKNKMFRHIKSFQKNIFETENERERLQTALNKLYEDLDLVVSSRDKKRQELLKTGEEKLWVKVQEDISDWSQACDYQFGHIMIAENLLHELDMTRKRAVYELNSLKQAYVNCEGWFYEEKQSDYTSKVADDISRLQKKTKDFE